MSLPSDDKKNNCFGSLDIVFPEGDDGLRSSPETCLRCELKTECLRTAMQGRGGIKFHEKKVDRAYSSGTIGFLERWSRKKALKGKQKEIHKNKEAEK